MTDREAIEALTNYEFSSLHFTSKQDEEVIKQAISALQEREKRSKGCDICNNHNWNGYFSWYEMLDCQTVMYDIKAEKCPGCGRPLKGADDETDKS